MSAIRIAITAFVLGVLLTALPASGSRHVPVASEVCEHNGRVVRSVQSGSVITVDCSSGVVVLVRAR